MGIPIVTVDENPQDCDVVLIRKKSSSLLHQRRYYQDEEAGNSAVVHIVEPRNVSDIDEDDDDSTIAVKPRRHHKSSHSTHHHHRIHRTSRHHHHYGKLKKTSKTHHHHHRRIKKRVKTTAKFDAATCSLLCISALLLFLITHRFLSVYFSQKKWINAPITYMERTCPKPPYTTLSQITNNDSNATTTSSLQKTRICLTTLTDAKSPSTWQRFIRWRNFDGILELTWKNKLNYAEKHGYTIYDGSDLLDPHRPPAWTKIRAVQHLLTQDAACDWVMWMDADTIIMNSDIPIESFLPTDTTHDLLIGSDNGGGYNSGVFLFRNSVWSKQFLDTWWNMDAFVRPAGLSLSGDNHALKALLRDLPVFHNHVLSPARCTFNSFAQFLTVAESRVTMDRLEQQDWYLSENYYHKGDFLAHTPGYDNKAETLQLLLQEAR